MGNSNGKYNSIYSTMPQVADWEFEFNKLQLRERDVGQLFKAFEIMDTNKSMGLSRDELLKHLDLKRSRFAHRVFYVFDIDRSGEIDFFEFAFSVWNYCTAAVGSLVSFTFDIYATGQNGGLTLEDMDRMVVEIHGEDYQRNVAAARIVVEFHKLVDFEKTGTRELKAAEFVKFCAFHRSLLYPVFSLQDKFQDRICGRKFWADLSKRRMMVADIGDYVKVEEILNARLGRGDRVQVLLKKKNLFEEKDDDGLGNEMVEPFDPRKHAPKSRAGFFRSFLRTPKEMREKMELPKEKDPEYLLKDDGKKKKKELKLAPGTKSPRSPRQSDVNSPRESLVEQEGASSRSPRGSKVNPTKESLTGDDVDGDDRRLNVDRLRANNTKGLEGYRRTTGFDKLQKQEGGRSKIEAVEVNDDTMGAYARGDAAGLKLAKAPLPIDPEPEQRRSQKKSPRASLNEPLEKPPPPVHGNPRKSQRGSLKIDTEASFTGSSPHASSPRVSPRGSTYKGRGSIGPDVEREITPRNSFGGDRDPYKGKNSPRQSQSPRASMKPVLPSEVAGGSPSSPRRSVGNGRHERANMRDQLLTADLAARGLIRKDDLETDQDAGQTRTGTYPTLGARSSLKVSPRQ